MVRSRITPTVPMAGQPVNVWLQVGLGFCVWVGLGRALGRVLATACRHDEVPMAGQPVNVWLHVACGARGRMWVSWGPRVWVCISRGILARWCVHGGTGGRILVASSLCTWTSRARRL